MAPPFVGGRRKNLTHPRANIPDLVHSATIIVHGGAAIRWTQEALVPGRSTTVRAFCVSLSLSSSDSTGSRSVTGGAMAPATTRVGVPEPDVSAPQAGAPPVESRPEWFGSLGILGVLLPPRRRGASPWRINGGR